MIRIHTTIFPVAVLHTRKKVEVFPRLRSYFIYIVYSRRNRIWPVIYIWVSISIKGLISTNDLYNRDIFYIIYYSHRTFNTANAYNTYIHHGELLKFRGSSIIEGGLHYTTHIHSGFPPFGVHRNWFPPFPRQSEESTWLCLLPVHVVMFTSGPRGFVYFRFPIPKVPHPESTRAVAPVGGTTSREYQGGRRAAAAGGAGGGVRRRRAAAAGVHRPWKV